MTLADQIAAYMTAARGSSLQGRPMMPGPLDRFSVADICAGVSRHCGWTVSAGAISTVLAEDSRFVHKSPRAGVAGGWKLKSR